MEYQNPLLRTLRLPGETVTLPSKALFYANGEVAPNVVATGGEIYVQPMTSYEEILMKTPDLLFTGQAIVQTFANCIPQIYNPLELLAADVDFLLIVLRKISLGAQLAITYHHNCENAATHDYMIDIAQFVRQAKYVDPSTVLNSFVHTLPNGQEVHLRPFRLKNVLELSQLAVNEPHGADVSSMEEIDFVTRLLTAGTLPTIEYVIADGERVDDPQFVEEWIKALPGLWLKELATVIESANKWGVDPAAPIVCKDCGVELSVQIPLNPQNFFTLPSDQEILN